MSTPRKERIRGANTAQEQREQLFMQQKRQEVQPLNDFRSNQEQYHQQQLAPECAMWPVPQSFSAPATRLPRRALLADATATIRYQRVGPEKAMARTEMELFGYEHGLLGPGASRLGTGRHPRRQHAGDCHARNVQRSLLILLTPC